MPKIEQSANGAILIDNKPYSKGNVCLRVNTDFTKVGIFHIRDNIQIVKSTLVTDYTDNNDLSFANYQDFIDYLDPFFFRNLSGGGGTGTGWAGEVNAFADLPSAASSTGETYLVKTKTGSQLTFNLKRSGFYQSDGVSWNKLSTVQFMFTDDELTFKDDSDNTKQLGFELSNISTGTRRTATFPDKNGTVAYTDDLFSNRIIVTQANFTSTLGGTIDSTKEYFLDGIIDTGTTQIEIPSTGLTLSGFNFDISGLTSSEDNYTMFVSSVGGSGNLLGKDYYVEVTGTNSQVYDLEDATGFNAFEFARLNFINCTSLGEIDGYRQGLENGTGRFGGSPSLTLSGTWLGGYRVVTSIVRNMSNTTAQPLFKAGTGFTMNSRFATDANVDLGALQPLLDFAPSNFVNPSTLQLQEMILTRGGTLDPTDTNITPNISSDDLVSYWKRNNGLTNTYVGGTITVISENLTTIGAGSTWYDLNGIFLGTGLQHFSANASGELTHDGVSPREFEFTGSLIVEGSANNSLSFRFNKWDDSASAFTPLDYTIQTRTVNSLVGGRDVAIFNIAVGGVLDQNDYLKLQIRNNSGNQNVTLENSSYYRVQER